MSAVQIPQSTSRVVLLKVFLTGTTTEATGKTVAVTLSKAGAAFGNPSAGATNATELSVGWYTVTLSTTDTNTLGDLIVRGTATGCDSSERILGVVKATTGGLTSLPDTAVTTNASLLTSGTGTDQLSVAAGKTLLQATQSGVTIPTVTTLTNYTAPDNSGIANAAASAASANTKLGTPSVSVAADIAALFTTALTESYNADGAAPTPAQALLVIMQMLTEMSISGTTLTVKKLDGSTPAFTCTLDSATAPTSVTRAA